MPSRSAIAATIAASLVISCSASRLICRSSSARFSAAAAMRFCVIRTKVDRKIASTEAAIASTVKDGSKAGMPKMLQRLTAIQTPNTSRCT
jgi:hypothetical protein